MIYLLDGIEFKPKEIDYQGKPKDIYADFNMSKIIYNKLKLASETNELIHTQWLRGLGKTYELVQYAKRNNLVVLEPGKMQAKEISEREQYDKIYPSDIRYLKSLNIKYVAIDEYVNNIQELRDAKITIVTGFYTPKKEDEKPFYKKVIQTLQNEIEALTPKLQQTRENRDYGTYKNLINAYREVLNLLKDFNKLGR